MFCRRGEREGLQEKRLVESQREREAELDLTKSDQCSSGERSTLMCCNHAAISRLVYLLFTSVAGRARHQVSGRRPALGPRSGSCLPPRLRPGRFGRAAFTLGQSNLYRWSRTQQPLHLQSAQKGTCHSAPHQPGKFT